MPDRIILLTPKTHKGKNRIKENGDLWVILREGFLMNNVVVDLPEDNDRFLIHPLNDEKYMRWLMKENDPDFEWADVKWTNITEEK